MKECIRRLTLDHLDNIMKIERVSYPNPWPSSVFVEELQHRWSTLWGFFPPGMQVPVGFLLFWEIYDELHVLNLAVHPDYRQNGLAKSLLTSLLEYGRRKNFKFVTLEVRRSNIPALNLYRQLGFQMVGVRKGYYCDNNEDALIMAYFLSASPKNEENVAEDELAQDPSSQIS